MFEGKFGLARLEEALNHYAPRLGRQVHDHTPPQGIRGGFEEVIVLVLLRAVNTGVVGPVQQEQPADSFRTPPNGRSLPPSQAAPDRTPTVSRRMIR